MAAHENPRIWLNRYTAQAAAERAVARAVLDSDAQAPPHPCDPRIAKAEPGDLRGIPCVAANVRGAIKGTSPHHDVT